MKAIRFLAVLTLVFSLSTVYAQKIKSYKAWVTLNDGSQMRGIFYAADSEALILMGEDLNEIKIDPKYIKTIQLRRKGRVGRGVWIGALSGAVVGGIAGYASGDDEPGWFSSTAEEKALGNAIFLSFPGAGIGALIGSARTIFTIDGNNEFYLNHLAELAKYALRNKQA